uniref:Gnk2-homologous domain-containing protein n=1 Tax=Nymphaea colorata TaxID=210225 RepID=A0A5K0ZEQ2_9MAGN
MGLTLLKIGIPRPLLLLLPLLLLSIHVDPAMSGNRLPESRCSVAANYTDGDEFELNMVDVFSTLRNEAPSTGFSNTTAGQGTEEVYGLVQCRGDVGEEECKSCISRATSNTALTRRMPSYGLKSASCATPTPTSLDSSTSMIPIVGLGQTVQWNTRKNFTIRWAVC